MGRKLHDADDGRRPRRVVETCRGSRFAEDIWRSSSKSAGHAALGVPRRLHLGPVWRALACNAALTECACEIRTRITSGGFHAQAQEIGTDASDEKHESYCRLVSDRVGLRAHKPAIGRMVLLEP